MRRIRVSKPSPALIVAALALFLALTGNAMGVPGRNSVDHNDLQRHVVHTGKIHNGAVKTGKLADSAVNSAKLADDAVTTTKLADGAVTSSKLGSDSVTSAEVADRSLRAVDLGSSWSVGTDPAPIAAGACGVILASNLPGESWVMHDFVITSDTVDLPTGVILTGEVVGSDDVELQLCNFTGGIFDPPSAGYLFTVIKNN